MFTFHRSKISFVNSVLNYNLTVSFTLLNQLRVLKKLLLFLVSRRFVRLLVVLVPHLNQTTESKRILGGTYQTNNECKHTNRSSLLEPGSLDVQLVITVPSHEQNISKTVDNTTDSAGNRMLQAPNKGNGTEVTETFKDFLMATLDTIEFIRLLVVSWCRVQVWVWDVVILSCLHDFSSDEEVSDGGKHAASEEDIAVGAGNVDGYHLDTCGQLVTAVGYVLN